MSEGILKYFEIEFGKKSELDDSTFCDTPDRFTICIKADHNVSKGEVEEFCKADMVKYEYDTICSIIEITEEEALDSYDLTDGDLPILTSPGKKMYKVPVSWEMYGYVYVEAEDLEEACSIAEVSETIGIPDDGEYIDCSWRVDWEAASMFNEED